MWWCVAAAWAAQLGFEADRAAGVNEYAIAWTFDGRRHDVAFALPADEVASNRAVPRKPDLLALAESQAAALRSWAGKLDGVALEVRIEGFLVHWSASGREGARVERAMREADDVVEAAKQRWLADQRVFVVRANAMSYDHAAIAAEGAADVRELAKAVSKSSDPRTYAAELLAFVQSIPYEAPGRGGDRGFRPPLAVLDRNLGDCDSKATLYLAMMQARFPRLGGAIVYVPGHALVALEIPAAPGDETVKIGGKSWVLAEPVGPRETPLGAAPDGHASQARSGLVRIVSSR